MSLVFSFLLQSLKDIRVVQTRASLTRLIRLWAPVNASEACLIEMASNKGVVLLDGSNFGTWKI